MWRWLIGYVFLDHHVLKNLKVENEFEYDVDGGQYEDHAFGHKIHCLGFCSMLNFV